uniref:WxxW domain-containing protein n=1 Tax=Ciona savignyi TaxID=51511 RepID=H2ZC75_CIOSA
AKCKAISRLANFVKQEGCVCNVGFIKSGFKCVPENQCGCVADGFYYEHGDIRLTPKCAEKCLCRNSVWSCTAEPCLSNQFCGIKSDRFGCHFIDECKTKNGGCSHICSTCNGTSSCKCPTGFGLDVDQKTCKKGLSSGSCSNALSEWKTSYAKWKQGNQDWKKSYNAYVTNSALPQTTPMIDCVEYDPTKPPQNTVYWSKWFDTDNPDGPGDNEMLEKIRNLHPTEVCKSPLAMEKKIVTGPSSTCVLGQIKIRTDEATKGLVCNNADQAAGVVCPDYAVRFLCLK